jgi:hypothetical protein
MVLELQGIKLRAWAPTSLDLKNCMHKKGVEAILDSHSQLQFDGFFSC